MYRFQPSEKFKKQVLGANRQIQKRIFSALKKLGQDPHSKGVHLEPITGREGFYTARVTLSLRLLLVERRDEQGRYFEILRYGKHDDTY